MIKTILILERDTCTVFLVLNKTYLMGGSFRHKILASQSVGKILCIRIVGMLVKRPITGA